MEKSNLPWPSEERYMAVALALISARIYSGSRVDDFVSKFEESAHIKDSKDFAYKLTNKRMLNIFGCDENEFLGRSVTSFFERDVMKKRWVDDYTKKIHNYDLEVIKSKQPIKYIPDPILDKNGFVFAHSGLKIPLFGSSNKINGIITFTFNITNKIRIRTIRHDYKKLYGESEIKNKRFGEQIGIPSLGILTEREIDCLISAARYRSGKAIARDIGISAKTVDMHLCRVREKLRCHFTDDLINYFLTSIESKGFSLI